MAKKDLGQFYTTNAKYILKDLLDIFPNNANIVDPFCGNWDLLNLVKDSHSVEGYDIDPKTCETLYRDSLSNPIDYKGKWILTNPPYLARNHAKDKTLFDKFERDDLFKISIESVIGCEGGIFIVPVNFFSCIDSKTRIAFLSKYKIVRCYIYEEKVFSDTSYNVCAFSFIKSENTEQNVDITICPKIENEVFLLKKSEGYGIANNLHSLKNTRNIKRLRVGGIPNSKIFISGLDTIDKRIHARLDEPYYGKNTDRVFLTLILDKEYSEEKQQLFCDKFNEFLNSERDSSASLFLINFRDRGRKRIGMDLCYSIMSKVIDENS